MPENKLENNLLLLYQKEVLLDEILAILNEEEIDLNNLLSITLERIEANHYEPPNDVSMESGLSLVLEDKIKMPIPKWSNPRIEGKLRIDLTHIGNDASGQTHESNNQNNNNNGPQINIQQGGNPNTIKGIANVGGYNKENIKRAGDDNRGGGQGAGNLHIGGGEGGGVGGQGAGNDMFSKLLPSGTGGGEVEYKGAGRDGKSKGIDKKFLKDYKASDEKSTKPGNIYPDTWSL
jgi:hypothetical protein